MSGTYIRGALAITVGLVVAVAVLVLQGNDRPALANHNVEFGVDLNTSDNVITNPNSIGTIGSCKSVAFFQTFDIDIIVKNVSALIATEAYFQYDPAILDVLSHSILFQDVQPGGSVTDTSSNVAPGIYRVGALETVQLQGDSDTGQGGVVARLSVRAIGTGNSYAKVSKIDDNGDGVADFGILLRDKDAVLIGDTVDADPFFDGQTYNGAVIVGASGDPCDPSADADGDGVIDALDNCVNDPNPGQENWNGDAEGDACDDSDGDGFMDDTDNCKALANAGQEDQDNDGIGDICDSDRDGDGTANTTDNCPDTFNSTQSDMDGDGLGDACDDDIDGDRYVNDEEAFMGTDMNASCPSDSDPDNEDPDAWPPDFNDTQTVNISDVLTLKAPFGSSAGGGPPYDPRYDITGNGTINISDVLGLKPVFSQSCIP